MNRSQKEKLGYEMKVHLTNLQPFGDGLAFEMKGRNGKTAFSSIFFLVLSSDDQNTYNYDEID